MARNLRVVMALVCVVVLSAATTEPASSWDDADWAIFQTKATWALETGLPALSMGETVAAVGRSFVGTAYVPHTLEVEGPERLVVDFRHLDCVTFVETTLALSLFVHQPNAATLLENRARAEAQYGALLIRVRYRGGVLDGYPSRLHYFSDWIGDAQAKGLVTDVTEALGGVRAPDAVDFMSEHRAVYRQLADSTNLARTRREEARLSSVGRWFIPEGRVAAVAPYIQDGDIIAVTSTVPGLDVAHTGLALWVGGTLRLLHAPLVGDSVQISEEPLAERILRIPTQDGVMVARPTEAR